MRKIARFLFLTVIIGASGCTLTLNSIFTDNDVINNPTIEGNWKSDDVKWTVKSHGEPGKYAINLTRIGKDESRIECYGILGTIGTNIFLEFTPLRPKTDFFKSIVGWQCIMLHSVWKVELHEDKLILTSMSARWLGTMIEKKKIDIKYEKTSDGMIFLTATTQELRELVAKYVDDPNAFPAKGEERSIVFERLKDNPPAQSLSQTKTAPWIPPEKWEKVKP